MKKMIAILTLTAAMLMITVAQATATDMKPGREMKIDKHSVAGDGMPMMGKMHQKPGMDHRGGDCGMRGQKGGFGPMMIEELDLSKDQIEKVEQIKIRYKKMNIDLDAEKDKLKIDKHQAMKNLNFSEAKNVVKKISDVRLKGQNARIDEMSEVTKMLSKEQIEKFKELHSAHGKMGMKKMNKMNK